jgi:hypothetical protein
MARTRRPNPNLTLENLDEDIARTMDRLDVLEGFKTRAEARMERLDGLINDLQTKLSAVERELAKRPERGVMSRFFRKRQ